MERLHLLLPALGPTVREAALQECNWDEERALTMLRRFQVGGASMAGVPDAVEVAGAARNSRGQLAGAGAAAAFDPNQHQPSASSSS